MKEGVVVASPCEGACDYCKYKSMCDFDGENERTVEGVTKQTILGAVQGEENDG
jgi:ATP-dependent helicase/DNAse subunit B